MKKIKKILNKIPYLKKTYIFFKQEIMYIISKSKIKKYKLNFDIMSLDETIKYILETKSSVIRFGDGEFTYINQHKPIMYQKNDDKLVLKLKECLKIRDEKVLICLPESLKNCNNLTRRSKKHWICRIVEDINIYLKLDTKYKYGNSFISRPYIIYKNKENAKNTFDLLKKIWENKNVLIVEGEYSRSGVGNDLFDNSKNIYRIICPSTDAFDVYEKILKVTIDNAKKIKDVLIIVALGPTSKPLVCDLSKKGFLSIDLGHIDSEYEWFLLGVSKKIKLNNKHTAESIDLNIENCIDEKYLDSILEKVGISNE